MSKLHFYRKQAGLSQAKLANLVEVSRQTINLIENHKYNPSLHLCIRIAKVLGSDLNTLFWEDSDYEEK
ncbi:helix-turn-helix transcriptional regulator [Apilactobacillus ozensis]|uniref:helix-turn-helix transcriptional regulator n=1 Tax=Apilactobacillus ozensis TaxID=866801 RepID=UPI0006D081C7|nr:helix-turn-helix transcriptional regulator [Apilactobacillus ozensis]MCK8607786.1 helix-turn-helix transcriptional regulator [Apilactobacillus ozensis]